MAFGIIAAGLAIGGSIASAIGERKRSRRVNKSRQRLLDTRVRIQEQQGLRSRRNLVREATIKGGAAAGAAGARDINVGSSAVLQAQASIAAQLASGISFQREQQDLREEETRQQTAIQRRAGQTNSADLIGGALGAGSTFIGAFA